MVYPDLHSIKRELEECDVKEKENDPKTGGRRSAIVFLVLAWATAACIVAQIFLAGVAVFTDPSYWYHHRIFVHLFEWLPVFMLVAALVGKLPKSLRWQSAALVALVFIQYVTANVGNLGAVHPVIAAVMFWLSLTAAREAAKRVRG